MNARHLLLLAVLATVAFWTCEAAAGMPSLSLSDWAHVRFETLSFAGALLLAFTAVVRWLWNYLARQFTAMPRLGYGRTLAMVLLVGFLLAVVLTMITGARELLTPGAWQKQGFLYHLDKPSPPPPSPAPPEPSRTDGRKKHLERLKAALWQYAAKHENRFPEKDSPAIAAELWEVPEMAGLRYVYRPGQKPGKDARLLAGEVNDHFQPWGHPVNWRDPALGINKSPDGFGAPWASHGANMLMMDASVRFLSEDTDPEVLKALATPEGNKKLPGDWDKQ